MSLRTGRKIKARTYNASQGANNTVSTSSCQGRVECVGHVDRTEYWTKEREVVRLWVLGAGIDVDHEARGEMTGMGRRAPPGSWALRFTYPAPALP